MLRALVTHASSDGEISAPLRTIAKVVDLGVMSVSRAIGSLEESGAISIDGDLTTRRQFRGRPVDDDVPYGWEEWSDSNPVITIREDLRGANSEMPLG